MSADPQSDRRRAQAQIAAIRARFIDGLEERLQGLKELALISAGSDPTEASAGHEALRLGLHNLAGSGPTLGFVDLGREAADIEARVIKGRRQDGGLDAGLAAQIAKDIAALIRTAPAN